MAETKPHGKVSQQQFDATMKMLWLTYFNETAFSKGLITEAARNKMKLKIKNLGVSKER